MKNYISCIRHWNKMFSQYSFYRVMEKFPIKEIKRKRLINKLDKKEVFDMLLNFDREAWMPITLDKENILIDGQHRLELAIQMGLEYIDVVIYNDKEMGKNRNVNFNSRRISVKELLNQK